SRVAVYFCFIVIVKSTVKLFRSIKMISSCDKFSDFGFAFCFFWNEDTFLLTRRKDEENKKYVKVN
ncbi:hypothetical protein, partial [Flavobacterium circumlabens]|uniref:hypothetical protein n=1 Tax=Flavobacterium circumlabens TaxID=2133765 RepID=UPI001EE91635